MTERSKEILDRTRIGFRSANPFRNVDREGWTRIYASTTGIDDPLGFAAAEEARTVDAECEVLPPKELPSAVANQKPE